MTDRNFDNLLDEWLAHELLVSPTTATALGADGEHGELDDLTAPAIAARITANRTWKDRLEAVDDTTLDAAQRVDRAAVISTIRGHQILESWEAWRRDPTVYLDPCFDGILMLIVHRPYPDDELASYTASRLRAVRGVLEAGKTNLTAELANPIIVGRSAQQCEAAVAYFSETLPLEFSDPGLRESVAAAGHDAADACRDFGAFLTDLKSSAKGTFAIGEERYSALLRERELLGYGAEELRERGRSVFAELDDEMNETARTIDPTTTNWRPVFEGSSADHPRDFDQLRTRYTDETARARAFLVEHELVSFPDDEVCKVEPTPAVLRPIIAVASYFSPPAFRPGRTGHFNVPWPPDGSSEEENEQRLAANSTQSIPTITTHEAYPGHHWHLTWMKATKRRIRHLVHSSYFSEGWALYSEKMMREQGYFSDDTSLLGHLNARLWRAGRIVVDTGLHIGDLSFEDAVKYMHDQVGLPEPVARAEVGRYCAWPTQAPSYLTGSLEIERIRGEYLANDSGDLRAFNDAIAQTGVLPLALAEQALNEGG